MNPCARSCWVALFFFTAFFPSCQSHGSNPTQQEPAILRTPAFAALSDSIRQFPNNADLYLRRAQLLSQINAHELAGLDYKRTWELRPDPQTALQYAANLSITGESVAKMRLLEQCVHAYPTDVAFRRLLAEANQDAGQPAAALSVYNSLLLQDSLDFETWYEKGVLLAKMRDTTGAILALKKACNIQPVTTYVMELAHLYAETKNPAALKLCDQVIYRDSARELTDPFFIKGIFFSNTAQFGRAIAAFDSCISRDWKFTDAYLEKGIALFKQKNYAAARGTFQLAVTVSNANPDAYFWIGRCLEAVGNQQEAILNYERAVALDRNFSQAQEAINRLKR
jgi:tetratricopeptide (TPR) repeat protein